MKESLDIAKNIRLIEWLKAQVITDTGKLYESMALGADSHDVSEHLAGLMIKVRLLSAKLGVGHRHLDMKALSILRERQGGDGDLAGEVDSLFRYLSEKVPPLSPESVQRRSEE